MNLSNQKSWLLFATIGIIGVVVFMATFVMAPGVVFGEGEVHPALSGLEQWDGTVSIPEGWILRHPFISSFSANIATHILAPYGRLQVEFRRFEEPFTGIDDGGILTSDPVYGGGIVRVPAILDGVAIQLSDGKYHWRARVIDNQDNASPWQEFGVVGNIDFEILTNQSPTTFWAAIKNTPEGVLRLRSSVEVIDENNIVKELPDDWALFIKDTHNNKRKDSHDQYIWWEVEDITDGVIGWMAAQSLATSAHYLEYDAEAQESLRQKTERLDGKERRTPEIINSINAYYINQAANNSLYNANGGRDRNNNFQRFISGADFAKEFVLAIAAQESGPDFDNEVCASVKDGGIGIMQITSPSFKGLGSGLDNRPKRNDCNKNFGWTGGPSTYYSNAFQGVYANIKDGMRVLQEKYREKCFQETSGGLLFTCSDIRRILTIWGYNGFGDTSGSYLNKIAAKLETLSQYFTGINYSDTDQFIRKLRLADRNKILAFLKSPGILYVEDKDGNVTGQTRDSIPENIPNSLYESEAKGVAIFFPKHPYTYRVVGTKDGTYGLNVNFSDEDIIQTFKAVDIRITKNAIHSFKIGWEDLQIGGQGAVMNIDIDGDGIIEHKVYSDGELTQEEVILQTKTTIDFDPNTLDIKNENGLATVYMELPAGYDVNMIDVKTVKLNNIAALEKPASIGDYDNDGVPDLMIKFDRSTIIKTLPFQDDAALITVTGNMLHNDLFLFFKGEDVVKLLGR